MSKPGGFPFAKVVAGLAVSFGVGFGLCGLSAGALVRGGGSHFQQAGVVVAIGSALLMLVSALALVPTVLVWIIVSAAGDRTNAGSAPQKLFEGGEPRDEGKHEDNGQ